MLHFFLEGWSLSLCLSTFNFSLKTLFIIIQDYFRLTLLLRLILATGYLNAVTLTSDVCNTSINRFVLKGSPYEYGDNFFWRSFWASGGIRGSKTLGGGFSLFMVSLTLCFLMCFLIFQWILYVQYNVIFAC